MSYNQNKIIENITPFTLLDFPKTPSAVIWFSACNMRCQFCYNEEIVLSKGRLCFDEIKEFFISRQHLLKGVVFCGGEPTIHNEIIEIAKYLKNLDFKIKLDTNGLNPKIIKSLLKEKLIDYIALDFKSTKNKFKTITNLNINLYKNFLLSLDTLINSKIDYEIRTTIHSDLLDENDIKSMMDLLQKYNYKKNYYLQNFISNKKTINNLSKNHKKISKDFIQKYMDKYNFHIKLRN